MQQKVVQITPKQFLFQSSVVTRTFAILFILFTLACIILTVSFMTIHTTSTDILGQKHWTGENPYLAYSGIATGILTIVCGIVILTQTVKIFGWSWNTPLGVVVIFSSISLALMIVDFIFLYKRECVDPDKYLNQLGQCVCKGSLVEQNGMCGCPPATLRDGTLCLAGCTKDADCPSGQCGPNKFCCPVGTVACGDLCCEKQFCQTDDKGNKFCCTDSDRICKDKCCPINSKCIDKDKGICAFQCGPFQVTGDEQCHIQEGDYNTLAETMNVLKQQQIPEKNTDGSPKIQLDKKDNNQGTLYFVTKIDTKGCTWNPDAQYTPVEIAPQGNQVDFKPCIPTAQLRSQGNVQEDAFNICIPKNGTALTDKKAFDDCRQKSQNDCTGDCQYVNYAKFDYVKGDQDTVPIIRQALLYSIQQDTPGVSYVGNYCGSYPGEPKQGAINIVSRKVDGCDDPQKQALFCQLEGGYTNSMATFGSGPTCNAIIDCDQEVTGLTSQSVSTLGDKQVDTIQKDYPQYQDKSTDPTKTAYLYQPNCPTPAQGLDTKYWPNNLDQFRECPGSLQKLQSEGKFDSGTGETEYETYLCSKNTGQIYKGTTQEFTYYKLNFNFNNYDPRNPPDQSSLFQEIKVSQCDTQVWSGKLEEFQNNMCITPTGINVIMDQFKKYSGNSFITSNSHSTFRFHVKSGNEDIMIVNYGGVLTTEDRTQQKLTPDNSCRACNEVVSSTVECTTIFNGGFLRVIVDCCNWLGGTDRPIEASDRVAYFNDDALGHPFSALIIAEAPKEQGEQDPLSGQILQFNSNAGRCDNTNNYCDVDKAFAIAQCQQDYQDQNSESQVAWNWIPQDIDTNPTRDFIEKITGKKFLWQGRYFKFRKSNCTYAGRYVGFTNSLDPGTGCPGLNISPEEGSAAILSFSQDSPKIDFAPRPSSPTIQSLWWVWIVVAVVLLALIGSLYGGYVLSKTPQKRRQRKQIS